MQQLTILGLVLKESNRTALQLAILEIESFIENQNLLEKLILAQVFISNYTFYQRISMITHLISQSVARGWLIRKRFIGVSSTYKSQVLKRNQIFMELLKTEK